MPAFRLSPPQRARFLTAGGSFAPVLLIVGALAASALVFFLITRPAMKSGENAEVKIEPPKTAEVISPKPPVQSPKPAPTASPAPAAPAPPPPPAFGFARPQDLGKELARSLASRDFEKAGRLAAAADPAQAEAAAKAFETMVKELGAQPGREDQVELLGMVENKTRLALPMMLPGQDAPVRLELDLERDERMGWKISQLHLPKQLAAAAPTKPMAKAAADSPALPRASAGPNAPKGVSPMTAAEGAKGTSRAKVTPQPPLFAVNEESDALAFGSDFVKALLKHDFAAARKFVDEAKVPAERLVGLCIVFEEGKYEFKPNKPMIITVANPEVSWVIAQVQSQALEQSTEFGLEMQRSGTDQPWKVVGLNLSEILSSFAASAGKLGVPYTPIVTNPKGGESLALYFEYDKAQLHPRAQRQLEIVAQMLKSDASRHLKITGHTDAKGTEDYNMELSQERAEAVKAQLVGMGVDPNQVITSGVGMAEPLGPNQKADGTDDPAGRSKNRRAEIYLDF